VRNQINFQTMVCWTLVFRWPRHLLRRPQCQIRWLAPTRTRRPMRRTCATAATRTRVSPRWHPAVDTPQSLTTPMACVRAVTWPNTIWKGRQRTWPRKQIRSSLKAIRATRVIRMTNLSPKRTNRILNTRKPSELS
jgi:hypothetical protein